MRQGVDTAFDEGQMKVGRRLAIKVLNASKFVLSRLGPERPSERGGGPERPSERGGGEEGDVTAPLDKAMLAGLASLVEEVTTAFDGYDYARALERTETFFWSFCDDYLELVKSRAYGGQGDGAAASANQALTLALSTLLRLFAPFLPFVTEEVWSWWNDGSVHRASWPAADDLRGPSGTDADARLLEVASAVLGEVRKAKTVAQASMRADVARAVVRDTPERLTALAAVAGDVRDAGRIAELVTEEAESLSVEVELLSSGP